MNGHRGGPFLLLIMLAAASCSPTTHMEATASVDASPQGPTVAITLADRYAEALIDPDYVVYIGLGRCSDGEDRLQVEGVADGGVSKLTGRIMLTSRPFTDVKVEPGTCTQLFTASMMPFSRHYRTGLIRVR